MAAYGALLSLSHLLHQILHPPPLYNNIIIIDTQQIEFLRDKIELLIDFLETYPTRRSEEIADLEARIRDAAYAAEDIIESNVIDQIYASDLYKRVETSILSSPENEITTLSSLIKKISTLFRKKEKKPTLLSQKEEKPILLSQKEISTLLCEGIETVLEKFVSIEKERELLTIRVIQGVGDVQPKSSAAATSSRSPLPGGKITMVGFDDHLIRMMSQLATDESSRQIIPIVGMGGIGKTTLASAVYNHPFIVEHFHIRAWITVSQEYNVRDLLLRLLSEINKSCQDKQERSNGELGLQLHKTLFGRKYLIVMDDMWDIQAWEELKMSLPHNENGSRVLITSRITNLVVDFAPHKMDILDKVESWDLFCKILFVEEDCPVELKKIGKYIVERCSGLPLAIVLISGLLAKSERTKEHWNYFAREMTSALNFGNDEQVMKILSLSYTHLPIYLKPCFLYLAMFPEDYEIPIHTLIRLWVAEGLIKPTQDKCLEEIAHEHLEDLISRNVILVGARGSMGNVKSCKLHDLVRDFCIRKAAKEKFVCIAKLNNISQSMETVRRLSDSVTGSLLERTIMAFQSASLNRSWLILDEHLNNQSFMMIINGFRLLKVVHEVSDPYFLIEMLNLINLRYVYTFSVRSILPMVLCWNLQTLLLPRPIRLNLPPEIWLMPQLRHLKICTFTLPDPPDDDQNVIVLENLQTIKGVTEFKCSEHVLKRIPNLKKLGAVYCSLSAHEQVGFRLYNLACFKKLESLRLKISDIDRLWPTIAFPISLKKLALTYCWIPWKDLSIVGLLPNLEVLKLEYCAVKGKEWNPIEGQFCRLKFLMIDSGELKIWEAEDYHFPCLERLFLINVNLKMIPMSFSEILTLKQIDLRSVKDSLWTSAKEISNEREQLGYEPLLLLRGH